MKIDRLVSIVMLLIERPRVQASELADLFQVSQRTIYRDIESLSLAGLPIVTYPGVGGGIALMEQYKLDKRLLNPADLAALLRGLGSLRHSLPDRELARTLAKLKGFIPSEQADEIELKANQVIIDPTPWGSDLRLKPLMDALQAAISEHRLFCFHYLRPDGAEQQRCVEPYCLMSKSLRWYLQGFCLLRQEYRTFKLTRMSRWQAEDQHFEPRAFKPITIDEESWNDGPRLELLLLFPNAFRSVLDEWCSQEQIQPYDEQRIVAQFSFPETEWIYQFILGWGPYCEVLAPQRVRAKVARMLKDAASLYPSS